MFKDNKEQCPDFKEVGVPDSVAKGIGSPKEKLIYCYWGVSHRSFMVCTKDEFNLMCPFHWPWTRGKR